MSVDAGHRGWLFGMGLAVLFLVSAAGILFYAPGILSWSVRVLEGQVPGPAGILLLGGLGGIGVLLLRNALSGRGLSFSPARSAHRASAGLDAIPDPCCITNRNGSLLYANRAYHALTGGMRPVAPDRLAVPDASQEEGLHALFRAAYSGTQEHRRLTLNLLSTGESYICDVCVVPLSPQPSPDGVLWHFRDTTVPGYGAERREGKDRRQAQNRSEHDLQVFDEAPFGVFASDPEGRLLHMNFALASLLGERAGLLCEHKSPIQDFIETGNGQEDIWKNPQPGLKEVVLKGAQGALDVWVMDGSWLMGEGRELAPVSLFVVLEKTGTFHAKSTPARKESPCQQGGETQGAYPENEAQFLRFFQNIPLGVALVRADGIINIANAAFVRLTHSQEGRAGKDGTGARTASLYDLIQVQGHEALRICLESVANGVASSAPLEVALTTQKDKVVQLSAGRVSGQGTESLTLVSLLDATERKSLELQFAQSQKMQAVGQLAGGVAHDFNNLLTAITGFCDLLLARHKAGDPSFADVMQIKQNANRAANLTRQLLAFSRRQTLRPRVLNLGNELAELSNLLARLLGETVELRMIHGRDLGLVKVDQSQLEQVIINLAVNARDAMNKGGQLTVRTANVSRDDVLALNHPAMPVSDYVLIEVADTGCGIEEENLEKIFEPFFTTKEVHKGTGLGLSTVYGIVQQTGGFIFPYSTVGKGTTFRIYLPRHYDNGEEKEELPEDTLSPARDLSGKGTILLVEDEDAVRTFAIRALTARGYTVLEAESGDRALEVVSKHEGPVDLVVSDVVMPHMDGPSMLKELRKTMPDVKVVFISGYAEDAFERSLDPDEQFLFLPKPFSLKQLAATVKKAIEEE